MFALTLVAACTIIMVGFHYLILEKIKEINSFYSCWIVSKSIEKLKVRINLTHKKDDFRGGIKRGGFEMGSICPICNGLESLERTCSNCGYRIEDKGRVMDYYDDYSAYMPIDQMKLENGYQDLSAHLCPHLVLCPQCGQEEVLFIQE